MVKREIKHEEIRKGDRIRVTRQAGDLTLTREGVAHRRDSSGDWFTESIAFLVGTRHADAGATITLLDRPRPVLPPAGTWIRIREVGGDSVQLPDDDNNYHVGLVIHHNLVETLAHAYVASEILDFEVIEFVTR